MPYGANKNLPKPVKAALPEAAQTIWRSAFNSAIVQYKDESKAAATAWSAVKSKFKKVGDKWVKKAEGVMPKADMAATKAARKVAENLKADEELTTEELILCEAIDLTKAHIWEERLDDGTMVKRMTVRLIQAGVSLNGNEYSEQIVEAIDALVDTQKKMFIDHLPPGKPKHMREFMKWAATIESHRVEGGELIAEVIVHDDDLFRRAKEAPSEVGASIDIFAKVKRKKVGDKEVTEVLEVGRYNSTDFVLFPSAGGRVANVAASMGIELKPGQEQQFEQLLHCLTEKAVAGGVVCDSTGCWIQGTEGEKMFPELEVVIENLKKLMTADDAETKFWKGQSAFRQGIHLIGKSEKLDTDAKKKTAITSLIDEYSTFLKGLSLESLGAKNPYEAESTTTETHNKPDEPKGGLSDNKEVSGVDKIETLAALKEAVSPEILKQYETEILAGLEEGQTLKALEDDLKAVKETIAKRDETIKEYKSEADKTEAEKARNDLIESKLKEAKLPEGGVTDLFRKALKNCSEEDMDDLIADRKAVVKEKVKTDNGSGGNQPAPNPKTGDNSNPTESATMDAIYAGFRSGRNASPVRAVGVPALREV